MIYACLNRTNLEIVRITPENTALLQEAIWVDLLTPTKEEESIVETGLHLSIPTREEMVEIELSSRLYKEDGILFMTAIMIAQSDTPEPKFDPVTFVLGPKQIVSIRYIEPHAFKIVSTHLKKLDHAHHDSIDLFIELLEATVDRLADLLELVGRRLDDYSKTIFHADSNQSGKLNYPQLMRQIGANGDLNTKSRESLLTFNRLIAFLAQNGSTRISAENQVHLTTIGKDIGSLSDHANFLSTKVNFLLDATLGMVNIEQNNIIKIFSVAAVIFLPPTLIASIYGMNFHEIPELSWRYGYVYSICMIMLAAWLPYRYFKYKKWL